MKALAMTRMSFCCLIITLLAIPQHISAQPSSLVKNNDLISLRSVQNNKIVRAGITQETLLGAVSDQVTSVWETFRVIKVTDNRVVFILDHSGKIVRAGIGPRTYLAAVVDELVIGQNAWAYFEIESKGANKVALKSALSGKYVSVTAGPDGLLRAVSDDVGKSETFEWISQREINTNTHSTRQQCLINCAMQYDDCRQNEGGASTFMDQCQTESAACNASCR